ncbi:MAG: nicotinate-nucleotide adenylyltransferase [Lachnospiraceae bacterium]|nr:nicotinate-nucleotide adenylyltransferase [Lachnospiraceae bacterium]
MRYGILGGTFNPIHKGHVHLAEEALKKASLDKVFFVPTGVPYLKKQNKVLDSSHRLKMVELAIEGNPNFEASDIEIKREGDTYTFETLQEFNKLYPEDEFFFIMGADCLFTIENWYKPEIIFELSTLIAVGRDDLDNEDVKVKSDDLRKRFGAKIITIDFEMVNVSSTMIREALTIGSTKPDFLDEKVFEYIKDNHLYES